MCLLGQKARVERADYFKGIKKAERSNSVRLDISFSFKQSFFR